jgi:type II secretory pathway component HofQ
LWAVSTTSVLSQSRPAQGETARGQLPFLPLTQLDERAASAELDTRTVSLTVTEPQAMRGLLVAIVRGTSLSVAADPSVNGAFAGDLKNVTVRQALDLVLRPAGLDYTVDGTLVRVFRREPETRIFDLNYVATARAGSARVADAGASSGASVSTTTNGDVFADLAGGVRALLSEHAAFSVDRKAGLLQVTDVPDRLDRVALYLDAVQERVHRQAQIDVRVLEVELTDDKAAGVDWPALTTELGVQPQGVQNPPARPSLTGMRVADPGRLVHLLEAQGKVTVVASPRLVTLNNEPAIVRTDALTISVTPQIAADSIVTLSLSPIVRTPALAESDLLARVADGETLVVSGFTSERETRERKTVGTSGGWFGRGTVVTRRRVELVILLTPKVISGAMAP